MPHPKNHMKLTGDIHPPEVEFDLDADFEDDEGEAAGLSTMSAMQPAEDRAMRADTLQAQGLQLGASADRYFDAAREQVRTKPFATLGAAFALGFVLAKLFR